jgi:hypothetical protein
LVKPQFLISLTPGLHPCIHQTLLRRNSYFTHDTTPSAHNHEPQRAGRVNVSPHPAELAPQSPDLTPMNPLHDVSILPTSRPRKCTPRERDEPTSPATTTKLNQPVPPPSYLISSCRTSATNFKTDDDERTPRRVRFLNSTPAKMYSTTARRTDFGSHTDEPEPASPAKTSLASCS